LTHYVETTLTLLNCEIFANGYSVNCVCFDADTAECGDLGELLYTYLYKQYMHTYMHAYMHPCFHAYVHNNFVVQSTTNIDTFDWHV